MSPLDKIEFQPDRQPVSGSSPSLDDLRKRTEELYALAFANSIPFELRKIALLEVSQWLAKDMVSTLSVDPNVECKLRLMFFLTLSLLGVEDLGEEQLSLAVKASTFGGHEHNRKTLGDLDRMAQQLAGRNQLAEAVVVLRAAIKFGVASVGVDFPDKVNFKANLATVLFNAGRYGDAELARQEELQLRHLDVSELGQAMGWLCQEGLADAIAAQGRLKEAGAIYATVFQAYQRCQLPTDSPGMLRIRKKVVSCNRAES